MSTMNNPVITPSTIFFYKINKMLQECWNGKGIIKKYKLSSFNPKNNQIKYSDQQAINQSI